MVSVNMDYALRLLTNGCNGSKLSDLAREIAPLHWQRAGERTLMRMARRGLVTFGPAASGSAWGKGDGHERVWITPAGLGLARQLHRSTRAA